MKKLRVAVSITGKIWLLEKFPDDEEHAGLKEMLFDVENDCESNLEAGIYLASFWIEQGSSYLDFSLEKGLDLCRK